MKKISCLTLLILLSSFFHTHAQYAIGDWQSHLSYHFATLVAPAGNIIYTVGNGGLYSYDKEDESVQCYWKENPLSDTEISNIAYNKATKTLFIIYSNSNIDLLVNDQDVYNLPEYKDKNMNQDKTVYNISFEGDYAYLSTSFGIIVVNLKKKEFTNTYNLSKKVNDCVVLDNKIYAATDEGLFTGLLTDNLLNVNNWTKVSNSVYIQLEVYEEELIGSIAGSGIQVINREDFSNKQLISGTYEYLNVCNDILLGGNYGALVIFDSLKKYYYLQPNLSIRDIKYENGMYWVARGDIGLSGLKFNSTDRTFEPIVSSIIPNSPKRNYPYYMTIANDRLLIAGGTISSKNPRKGTIMMYEDGNWNNFQEDDISTATNVNYQNITCIAQDPRDENRHYASSFGHGLYEFYDGKFVKQHSMHNSTLESAITNNANYVKIDGLNFDKDNNLWMLNAAPTYQIQVLKADGKWVPLSYSSLDNPVIFKSSIIDRYGKVWGISSYINDYGVFCLDYNGTIENNGDDKHKFVEDFTNQDGVKLNHSGINCIAEDQDGAIWIGTTMGPIILNNTQRFFEDSYYCTQIKVARNDGSNLADYLLANEKINAIAIDGGNRKWIGTEDNGVYLLSADGTETIHHFTEENSPLISNNISSIAIHPKKGTVYIGTLKGLVSYQGDATEGESSFEDDQVYAYPNPVHPGYTGVITVTGLMRDSNIKITNISGKLIYEGTSTGGQFTWDGRNMQGNRVASGVYFVLAANAEGNEGIVTKILFIR